MSDYLWDKTGDADAEVERLEELLGALRHQPRPLDLPAEAEASSSHAVLLQPRRFRPALLAAAAALLLMMLAGAVVLLRQNGSDGGQQAESHDSKDAPGSKQVNAPREEFAPQGTPERRVEQADTNDAPLKETAQPDFRQANLNRQRHGAPGARGAGAHRQLRQANPERAPLVAVQKDATAPNGVEQQAAKEQLVYALRLASAKLNEVQKMTRGGETPGHAFNERNGTR